MKIRLSAPGMSLGVEVPEEKAMNVYRGLAEKLLIHAGDQTTYAPKITVSKNELVEVSKVADSISQTIKDKLQSPESEPTDLPEEPAEESEEIAPPPEQNMTEDGHRGFLLIRCASCGHEKAYNSRFAINLHKCPQCGEKTILGHLRKLWAHCECGQDSHYLTNIEDDTAEVNCVACGAPVACSWNAKKKCYQTIKE